MLRDKVRIRFRKTGDLRLISHHDLMRCFERMLRRAALPFHSTSGFNPKPRLIFAMPLALGIQGNDEIAELELTEEMPLEDLQTRLREQAPGGLEILEVKRIDCKTTAHVRRVCYRVELPVQHLAGLPERIDALFAAEHCWVERARPQPRRIDVRPYLSAVRAFPAALEVELFVTPTGTARPEEILGLLDLNHALEAGAIFERVGLELEEDGPTTVPVARATDSIETAKV